MASKLQIQLQQKTALLNAIAAKEAELLELRQNLKQVNIEIYLIDEGKQLELPL